MILSGAGRTPGGEAVTERITWELTSHDGARQLWERSSGAATGWTVVFDGR